MKYIFLIRHTESIKNLENTFSSTKDDECLTPNGVLYATEIAKHISEFASRHSYKSNIIYSANSTRSIETAKIIANTINAKIQVDENLRSTRPGILMGAKKDEIKLTHPEYAQQYYLFEKGVFNVYDFKNPNNKEPKKAFENRVNTCVEKIISGNSDDFQIIIGHRSSLTAILLYFARKFHNYPENFSGHIPLDLGYISIIREVGNNWEILKVNEKIKIIDNL